MSDTVGDLKQACLDLSNAALAMFDLFEQHELDAAWTDTGPFVVRDLMESHERLRLFLLIQTTARMRGLGLSYEQIAKVRGHNGSD